MSKQFAESYRITHTFNCNIYSGLPQSVEIYQFFTVFSNSSSVCILLGELHYFHSNLKGKLHILNGFGRGGPLCRKNPAHIAFKHRSRMLLEQL